MRKLRKMWSRPPAFANRAVAGEALADELEDAGLHDPVVLGLPRGGVAVAAPVARRLGAPLDALVVAKVGVPGHEELAAGAVGEGGVEVVNEGVVRRYRIGSTALASALATARAKVESRIAEIRAFVDRIDIAGRAVIIVDDGLATGATAHAAIEVARAAGCPHIILAVPVAPADAIEKFRALADEVVTVMTPSDFLAVGMWYRDFTQTSTREVVELLRAAR